MISNGKKMKQFLKRQGSYRYYIKGKFYFQEIIFVLGNMKLKKRKILNTMMLAMNSGIGIQDSKLF